MLIVVIDFLSCFLPALVFLLSLSLLSSRPLDLKRPNYFLVLSLHASGSNGLGPGESDEVGLADRLSAV